MQYAQLSMPLFYHNYTRNQFLFGLNENICWYWLFREIRIDVNHKEDNKLIFLTEFLNDVQNDNFVFV